MSDKTTADTKLLSWCPSKIKEFKGNISIGRPYVWELRLSAEDFNALEQKLKESISSHNNDHRHLICEEFALYVVIYLAEWYKRFYKGREILDENKVLKLSTFELEKIYGYAHIDTNTFVYNASKNPDKPSKRWAESLQILGGLAIQAEIKRDENDSLLIQLCKIFHGEDISLDDVKDRNRAVAFQESIYQKHSLYEYLDCILDKDKEAPFNKKDIKDEETLIPDFLKRIETADYLAQKHKFDFEWIISYIGIQNLMVRHLKVKLKPEVIGGGRKQYLGYERLRRPEWGIENPENIGRINFYLRFKNDKICIQKEGINEEPIFKYDNTGFEKTGFLSIGNIDENIYTNVPTSSFNKVEIVMKYGTTERVVQTLHVEEYLQIYDIPKSSNKFSDKRNSQAATVAIFSSKYRLAEAYRDNQVVYARFKNQDDLSEEYCWCPINDKIILEDPYGKEIVLFNRNGLYQVITKKYLHTIHYKDNIYVLYKYIDVDYDDDEVQEEYIPILFGRQGLEVLHYDSGTCKDGKRVHDYDLEWLKEGRYIDWKIEEPKQGYIKIRTTVKGIVFKSQVYYVPFEDNDSTKEPIWRDFAQLKICTAMPDIKDIQDTLPTDINTFEPNTKVVEIGDEASKVLIEVYRPFILRELSYKGSSEAPAQVLQYYPKGERIRLPLISCDEFSIRDFSEKGVKTYQINNKIKIFNLFTTIDDPEIPSTGFLEEINTKDKVEELPIDCLSIYLTRAVDNANNLYGWTYNDLPKPVSSTKDFDEEGIIFQSRIEGGICKDYCMPTIIQNQDWWGGATTEINADVVHCYETVIKHHTYFFLFKPLIQTVHKQQQISELFIPLVSARNFVLSKEDIENLNLFAAQFHFDWMLMPREKWISELNKISDSRERKKVKEVIELFFAESQKCADENEKFCLAEFISIYWDFNQFTKIDSIAEVALRLILNEDSALGKYLNLRDFLRDYDACKYKFSEMSKALTTNH